MSELERAFSYDDDGRPVMVIYKRQSPVTTFRLKTPKVEGYLIPLDDAWMFARDKYPALVRVFYGFDQQGNPIHGEKVLTYEQAMYAKCDELCQQFDLGLVTSRKMADIASMIEDGIDDLVRMKPQRTEKIVVGEVNLTLRDPKGAEGKIEATTELTEERRVM